MTKLVVGSEGNLVNNEGELFSFRIYKDGVVKLEGPNSLDFFDTITEFKSYFTTNNLITK